MLETAADDEKLCWCFGLPLDTLDPMKNAIWYSALPPLRVTSCSITEHRLWRTRYGGQGSVHAKCMEIPGSFCM